MAAATPSLDELLRQLSEAVCDELKIITYKWFARTHDLPANYAKQVLFRFVEEQQERVRAVYMIAGTLPAGADEGADARSVVRLVDAQELSRARSALHTVTSLHVHRCDLVPQRRVEAMQLCCQMLLAPVRCSTGCWSTTPYMQS
jgi:DNA polymerase subunit Cdc27